MRKDHFVPLLLPQYLKNDTKGKERGKRKAKGETQNLSKVPKLDLTSFVGTELESDDNIHSRFLAPSKHAKPLILQSRKHQVKIDKMLKKCSISKNRTFVGPLSNTFPIQDRVNLSKYSEIAWSEPKCPDAAHFTTTAQTTSVEEVPLKEVSALINTPENDIGILYKTMSTFSDDRKFSIPTSVLKPNPSYEFPPNSSGRRFQYKWFDRFPWLAYSKAIDGAFCIDCVTFGGESTHNASKLSHLFKTPLTDWSKAIQ